MKKVYLLLVVCFCMVLAPAQQDEVLAVAGNKKITVKEFRERFELSPRLSESSDIETTKREFLLTLIAEKFLSQEAIKLNSEIHPEAVIKLESLKKKYTRDKLFEEEIINKIEISKEEVLSAISTARNTLYCKFIISESETEINEILGKLNKGKAFDSLLNNRPEKSLQQKPVKVEFGQMDEHIEKILFELKPGQYTIPLLSKAGWVIYYIDGKDIKAPDLADKSALKKIKDVIKDRKLAEYHDRYIKKTLSGVEINADGELFSQLVVFLTNELNKLYPDSVKKQIEPDYNLIQSLKYKFSATDLNRSFIKFPVEPVSLNGFINAFSAEGFILPDLNKNTVEKKLSAYVKNFIKYELLYREALKYGFDKSDYVKQKMSVWEDNFNASLMRKKIINELNKSGSVDEKKLYENYVIKTAELSLSYNIKIYGDRLKRTKVNPINLFAYQKIGFGGTAVAFPYASKFDEWMKIRNELLRKEQKSGRK